MRSLLMRPLFTLQVRMLGAKIAPGAGITGGITEFDAVIIGHNTTAGGR